MLKAKDYFKSFDQKLMPGVRQALEYFGCCDHILAELNEMHKEQLENARKDAEKFSRGPSGLSALERAEKKLARIPGAIVGEHECGGKIIEYVWPSCESTLTGRKIYRECNKCTWYSEVFLETREVTHEGG